MSSIYNMSGALNVLAQRGISVSPGTIARYIREGVVSAPVRLASRPIWDDDSLDQLARQVADHRRDLAEHGYGAHRRAAA